MVKDVGLAPCPAVERKNRIRADVAAAIENNLMFVGGQKPRFAGLVSVDEHGGVDAMGEGVCVFGSIIAAPNKIEERAAVEVLVGREHPIEDSGVKPADIGHFGNRVRNEDSLFDPDGDRATSQEREIGLAHFVSIVAVAVLNAKPKEEVQDALGFLDGKVGEFGQFVIAHQEVDALGEVDDQLGDGFKHAVRLASAVGIFGAAVADFLEDQVAARVFGQIGDLEDAFEILEMAVQIASEHDVVRNGRVDFENVSDTAGGAKVDFAGSFEESDDLVDRCSRNVHKLPPQRGGAKGVDRRK